VVIAGQRRGVPIADFVNPVMRAVWAEDRDVSDPAVLAALAERCGLNGTDLLDAAGNQAVRQEYRGNTARALAARVFGSPFYIFAGELFWGQDRLDMLEGASHCEAGRVLGIATIPLMSLRSAGGPPAFCRGLQRRFAPP
jgi:2-hydroxychromene-2-carboxylate isomerase